MHGNRRRVRVVGHAGVVPGVGERGLGDQQLAGSTAFRLLGLQANAATRRVEVHHGVAVVPGDEGLIII